MKARNLFVALIIILLTNGHVFSSDDDPLFLKKMSAQELQNWNELNLKLELARSNKNFGEALRLCDEIRSIHKVSGEIAYAVTYRMMFQDDAALKWAKKSIESAKEENSSLEKPMLLLSSTYTLMENNTKANEVLDEIIKLYPERPLAYKFYAEYYEQIGDAKNALYYWQEALKRFTDERAIEQAKERIAALEKSQ